MLASDQPFLCDGYDAWGVCKSVWRQLLKKHIIAKTITNKYRHITADAVIAILEMVELRGTSSSTVQPSTDSTVIVVYKWFEGVSDHA